MWRHLKKELTLKLELKHISFRYPKPYILTTRCCVHFGTFVEIKFPAFFNGTQFSKIQTFVSPLLQPLRTIVNLIYFIMTKYDGLLKPNLQALLRQRNIKFRANLRKDALIELLVKDDEAKGIHSEDVEKCVD